MVSALLRKGVDLTLYMPSQATHAIEPSSGTYDVESLNLFGRRGQFLWGQFVLPRLQARVDAPDFYWGPAHRLPPFLPKKTRSFVTIHDLVWKYAGLTMRSTSTRLLEAALMPSAIARSNGIIAVSDHTRSDIIRAFPNITTPISTIYPGVSRRPSGHDRHYLQNGDHQACICALRRYT